jgi:hypothetical protein
MATRLRFGAEQWDMPSPMFDFPGANDHAPMLWTDSGIVYLFWGSPRFNATGGAFPFQWTTSKDSGLTWSEVNFPVFKGRIGPHSRQPINTALRDREGTIYVSSDGSGSSSVLWATRDNGKTWYDTGGRSAGRHTTYALLKDGSILGMGGKNTHIDGYMPRVISKDGGKTWKDKRKTPFSWLGMNQRPSILRLESGRLFFAGDFQCTRKGAVAEGIKERGAYVALSEDEGETWHIKPLAGAQMHERRLMGTSPTVGYSAARQAPNGVIHLITSMNRPSLHFAMNEAWILDMSAGAGLKDDVLMKSSASSIGRKKKYKDKSPNGKTKARYSGGIADDGRFLLDGPETWYYESGSKLREAEYKLGRKVGTETYYYPGGSKKWQWVHSEDGTSVWTQWWEDGTKKAESTWKNLHAEGKATTWGQSGKLLQEHDFGKRTMKSPAKRAMRTTEGSGSRKRRILYNNDGCGVMFTKAGCKGVYKANTDEKVIREAINEITEPGSQVDTWLICVNEKVMFYPTKVGSYVGYRLSDEQISDPDARSHGAQWRRALDSYYSRGADPYAIMIDQARKKNLEVMLSYRMNDQHGNDFLLCEFWRKKKELRTGRAGLDFASQKVRDYKFSLLKEAVQRYDIDGLELDFNRRPPYFKPNTPIEENRVIITKMVKRIRKFLDEEQERRNKKLIMSVRVPMTMNTCLQHGLDPVAWHEAGLLDFLTVSQQYRGHVTLPIQEFKDALGDLPVYACIEADSRNQFVPKLGLEGYYRKAAANMWADGADGIYLFNFFVYRESGRKPGCIEPPFAVLKELGDQ